MPITLLALLSFLSPVLLKLLRWLVRCRSTEVIRVAAPPPKPVISATNLRVLPGPTKKVTDGTCRFLQKLCFDLQSHVDYLVSGRTPNKTENKR